MLLSETIDPNVKVAGNGIRKLKEAGKQVVTIGVLESGHAMTLNKRFFTFHNQKAAVCHFEMGSKRG